MKMQKIIIVACLLGCGVTYSAAKKHRTVSDSVHKLQEFGKKKKKGFAKRITSVFEGLFGNKKEKEETREIDVSSTQPPSSVPKTRQDVQDIVATLQTAAVEVPEIYALLINTSVESLLEKVEKCMSELVWGNSSEFINSIEQKSLTQRPKASLLLQIRILESYIDARMPFKHFIEDVTKEKDALERYENAIFNYLSLNEFIQANEVLQARVNRVLTQTQALKKNLMTLNRLVVDLLADTENTLEPGLFKDSQNKEGRLEIKSLTDK